MPYGGTSDNMRLETESVPIIRSNIKKLDVGRIDAFITYIPDTYNVFEELGIEPYPHAKDKPIAIHEDSLVRRGVSKE